MTETPKSLNTNPKRVEEYAQILQQDASQATIRGLIAFEDRGDHVTIVEVGSCSPMPSRMLLGLLRFVLKEVLGLRP